ncbi:MAG: phosphoglycerate dehydrogenase [Bacteroidia bacterium]|nr:phosphoglycerate dehydrogenase [Bacteroidia bacterium]
MKILLIDDFSSEFISSMTSKGYDFRYFPEARKKEISAIIGEYEVLIMNSKVAIDREMADQAKRLKYILRAGIGTDHFDMEYLAEKGIQVFITAGANADSVAEHAIGMLLGLRHNIFRSFDEVRKFEWKREANRGCELKGKTAGIIGYGHTGSAFARKLSGFGCEILAYDKYKRGFGSEQVQEAGPDLLMEKCDILSLHIPLTEETLGMINLKYLQGFHKKITFLNLSRGEIVVTEDLIAALDLGIVTAAGLDVLENEKFSTLTSQQQSDYENLFQRKNVILTPHIGGWSFESKQNIERALMEHLRRLIP